MVRILVVDDEVKVRAAVRMMLEEAGFEVVEAKDGKEAVKSYRAQPAALILCDLFMPGKDGLETIQELRHEFPAIKIIAISGGGFKGSVDLLPTARNLGAAEVLYKPADQASLLAAVQRLLGTLSNRSSF